MNETPATEQQSQHKGQLSLTETSTNDQDAEAWQDLGEELYRMSGGDDLGPLGERL